MAPQVRHPLAWLLTALLGALWLIGTLGSERIEPPLREVVSQVEVWRGLDLSRGPLNVDMEDTSPKKGDDKKEAKTETKKDASSDKPAKSKPKSKPTP